MGFWITIKVAKGIVQTKLQERWTQLCRVSRRSLFTTKFYKICGFSGISVVTKCSNFSWMTWTCNVGKILHKISSNFEPFFEPVCAGVDEHDQNDMNTSNCDRLNWRKVSFFAPVHEDINVTVHFKYTCQIIVSALLGNLSACSDDPQESTVTVRMVCTMLKNFIFACEYHIHSQPQIVEEIRF